MDGGTAGQCREWRELTARADGYGCGREDNGDGDGVMMNAGDVGVRTHVFTKITE
ncbi:hypothetical protein BCR44DRAFT_1441693 [Catenaria anguillulae PL171]|uniref:Uncharacterized protein n=1 Tax=Catenaria anguillulae PL171 TaxID=765915 RepID=A0A1Y2HFG4_9FUNG|nr:hypothetical protein BCR44DRAFT_1441693 [Catenaria anguillulae PL171]